MRPKSEGAHPIHVALITPGFPADETDTPCIPALQEYLQGLGKYAPNVEVSVLTLRYPHRKEPYRWHGLQVFPSGGEQRRFPLIVASWFDLTRNFRRLRKQRKIDVIHSLWLGETSLLGTVLSRVYGIPHVVTLMGQDARVKKRYLWLLDLPRNTIVAVSEFQRRDDLASQGRDAAQVIPWGIDVAAGRGAATRDIDVIGVGSLIAVKDFGKFLRVVSVLSSANPGLRCVIAGDGPERPALEKLSRELQLEKTIRFEGAVPRECVLDLMARSRVLLHTSRFESYGFVFSEALANGVRIVSGPVGIAEAGPNWAVEEAVPAMAAAIQRFLAQPPTLPSFPYAVEETVQRYSSLYETLMRNRRRPALAIIGNPI